MRTALLWLIGLVPCSAVKRLLYRWCFGYHIEEGARLGLCLLDAQEVIIGKNCRIHSLVIVRRVRQFRVGDNVIIGPLNLFTTSVEEDFYRHDFHAADRTFITRSHRFDMSERITLGEECTIGGVSGAFWTHGAWQDHHPIAIGNKCFISDAAQILPGVTLGDNILVGAGAVVPRGNYPPDCLVLGNPATVAKEQFVWWRQKSSNTNPAGDNSTR